VTISGYHDVPVNNEESLLKALANQPLSVAIDASGRGFQFYSGVSFLPTITKNSEMGKNYISNPFLGEENLNFEGLKL